MNLNTSVEQLHKVGKALKKRLSHLGIQIAADLLMYYPFRYEDYSEVYDINKLVEGMDTTIKGIIEIISNRRSSRKGKLLTEAVVADECGRIKVVWFGQPYIGKTLKAGDMVYLSGKVKGSNFGLQMVGPGYEKVKPQTPSARPPGEAPPPYRGRADVASYLDTTHTARIVPIYSLTSGITQKQMQFLVKQIIPLAEKIDEWLPEDILDKGDFITLSAAIKGIHFPDSQAELDAAIKRLKFDELFILQLRAEMIRQSIKSSQSPSISFQEEAIKIFVKNLPFELTKDQKIASWECFQDMQKTEPMNRLLEGDVGAGKTVVAAMVMYNTILSGYQAAIMAPTEISAKQHFESLKTLLPEQKMLLLTGSEMRDWRLKIKETSKKKTRHSAITFIKNGEAEIIIGTHAPLTEDVRFSNLGLVIIDEQHRFGVEQRKTIRDKSGDPNIVPHFLSMTATPIPRSFALTMYGDLDLSVIKTMPTGRKSIKTRLVEPHNRQKAYEFIEKQVAEGRQVFVICPLIEIGEETRNKTQDTTEKKSVLSEYEKLSTKIFPSRKIAYLHGRMKSAEKDAVMKQFASGELDILVATSVVEVGVNIPNATVMMIEDAERFGLAQLHQFRGRVGRSSHQSYCFLFTNSDGQSVIERLTFFEQHTDGFKVAEYDLEMRGPGEVYGTSQSGMQQFRLATMKDVSIIKLARDMARGMDFARYPQIKARVEEWEGRVHLE